MNKQSILVPPYGIMDNDYLKNLGSLPGVPPGEPMVPPDFETLAGEDQSQRELRWIHFRDETIHEIKKVLWPVWDPESSTWTGAARDHMYDLTAEDLKILVSIRTGPGPILLDTIPGPKLRTIDCPAHRRFFLDEDPGKIFESYSSYDRSISATVPNSFKNAFFTGLAAKCSSTQLQFKSHLQRPRPYQMAFLLNETAFTWEEAISSMTPSMVSGHSLQGLLGVGAVMERILQIGMTFSDDSWEAFRHYAVDIGDRRVMAGVHYPSDNIASWIVLMRQANHVYRAPKVKEILWKAIDEESLVMRLIRSSKTRVYKPALELLDKVRKAD